MRLNNIHSTYINNIHSHMTRRKASCPTESIFLVRNVNSYMYFEPCDFGGFQFLIQEIRKSSKFRLPELEEYDSFRDTVNLNLL